MFMKRALTLVFFSLGTAVAMAADDVIVLTIENHAFSPQVVKVPAGQKIQLKVVNKDATPAEFESKPLGREKIIPGHASTTIRVGPLKPGRYAFVEEYHENDAAAQGTIVAE
jgi:plastocyanin